MKVPDTGKSGDNSADRANFDSTPPTGGISNVSQQDNGMVLMNKPEMDQRGSRADALIEIMGMDQERLGYEPPRMTKMKGV